MSAPEDWINKQVAIGISGAKPQLIIGELLEVSDRGVTMSVPFGVGVWVAVAQDLTLRAG